MNGLYGIDVSSYQGKIDWRLVKNSGVEFAILKIIRKDLNPDKQFETNWSDCINVGMEIQGVYNYSYATTVEKAKTDAQKVLSILAGRKTFVWLDVEDSCQKGLGSRLIDIIEAYNEIIVAAGCTFGVYTGASFYNTYIKPYGGLNCPLWIAAYGINDGKQHETKRPTLANCIGWQYSSRGIINGISGYVDVNVFTGGMNGWIFKNVPAAALPTVKNGSKGTQAYTLQRDLNFFGYKLKEDGIFGAKSTAALKEWQIVNGLDADGIYGSKSHRAMTVLLQ